ncbi:MAG: hypothetical protein GY866_18305, partial [Proteobacteria bacterium]|nr:hypothetical protein [Pseudomonadota bacterium]
VQLNKSQGTLYFSDENTGNGLTEATRPTALDTSVVFNKEADTGGAADTTPPASPIGFTATAGDGQVALSWTNPTDGDFAGVEIRRAEGSAPASVDDGALVYVGIDTSHTDTGLANGTTYYYSIFAKDDVPNWSGSATASDIPAAASSSGAFDFEDGSIPSSITMSGDAEWTIDSSTSANGSSYGLKAGSIVDNEMSCFTFTSSEATTYISFYAKVSSEQSWDFLGFYVDSVKRYDVSGDIDWFGKEYTDLADQIHEFKWCYEKDVNGLAGSDTAWIDDINLIMPPALMIGSISGHTTEEGGTASFPVRLNKQPDGKVVVSAQSSDSSEGIVSSGSLTFTNADWDSDQTLIVTGVDDTIADGAVRYSVQVSIDSGNTTDTTGFADLASENVDMANSDNDLFMTAGTAHSCILLSSGSVECWGKGASGQLGNDLLTSSSVPVSVNGIGGIDTDAIQIAASGYLGHRDGHSCALATDGSVKCWGDGLWGQLGNGTSTDSSVPVPVSGIGGGSPAAIQVTTGAEHTCALLTDGTITCWGEGEYGRLGNGATTDQTTPVAVNGIGSSDPKATQVSAGAYSTCAVLEDGTARCWGYGSAGRLGNNGTSSQTSPVAVSGITNAVQISVGNNHACAVLADGTARCWGDNSYGQIGNSMSGWDETTPADVGSIGGSNPSSVQISAGAFFTCAVLDDGKVKCWGEGDFGKLGNDSTSPRNYPSQVSNITTAVQVSTGLQHACALLEDGTVNCWGKGADGQLGNNATDDHSTPVSVSNIP